MTSTGLLDWMGDHPVLTLLLVFLLFSCITELASIFHSTSKCTCTQASTKQSNSSKE